MFDALEASIGYTFVDKALLREALTHTSYVVQSSNGNGSGEPSNQRLEFLGDAVLQLIVTAKLYARYPAEREGILTQMRSTIVSNRRLAEVARGLNLGQYIILGEQEAMDFGAEKESILSDAFEALMGAIFVEGGHDTARAAILRLISLDASIPESAALGNPKGRLQEAVQAELGNDVIAYRIISADGPDHERTFEVEVRIADIQRGLGRGRSKKEAEEQAAAQALKQLNAILRNP